MTLAPRRGRRNGGLPRRTGSLAARRIGGPGRAVPVWGVPLRDYAWFVRSPAATRAAPLPAAARCGCTAISTRNYGQWGALPRLCYCSRLMPAPARRPGAASELSTWAPAI